MWKPINATCKVFCASSTLDPNDSQTASAPNVGDSQVNNTITDQILPTPPDEHAIRLVALEKAQNTMDERLVSMERRMHLFSETLERVFKILKTVDTKLNNRMFHQCKCRTCECSNDRYDTHDGHGSQPPPKTGCSTPAPHVDFSSLDVDDEILKKKKTDQLRRLRNWQLYASKKQLVPENQESQSSDLHQQNQGQCCRSSDNMEIEPRPNEKDGKWSYETETKSGSLGNGEQKMDIEVENGDGNEVVPSRDKWVEIIFGDGSRGIEEASSVNSVQSVNQDECRDSLVPTLDNEIRSEPSPKDVQPEEKLNVSPVSVNPEPQDLPEQQIQPQETKKEKIEEPVQTGTVETSISLKRTKKKVIPDESSSSDSESDLFSSSSSSSSSETSSSSDSESDESSSDQDQITKKRKNIKYKNGKNTLKRPVATKPKSTKLNNNNNNNTNNTNNNNTNNNTSSTPLKSAPVRGRPRGRPRSVTRGNIRASVGSRPVSTKTTKTPLRNSSSTISPGGTTTTGTASGIIKRQEKEKENNKIKGSRLGNGIGNGTGKIKDVGKPTGTVHTFVGSSSPTIIALSAMTSDFENKLNNDDWSRDNQKKKIRKSTSTSRPSTPTNTSTNNTLNIEDATPNGIINTDFNNFNNNRTVQKKKLKNESRKGSFEREVDVEKRKLTKEERFWENKFRELTRFYKERGHTNVTHADNPRLKDWCVSQRFLRKTSKFYSLQRIAKLNSIGFVWQKRPIGSKRKRMVIDSDSDDDDFEIKKDVDVVERKKKRVRDDDYDDDLLIKQINVGIPQSVVSVSTDEQKVDVGLNNGNGHRFRKKIKNHDLNDLEKKIPEDEIQKLDSGGEFVDDVNNLKVAENAAWPLKKRWCRTSH